MGRQVSVYMTAVDEANFPGHLRGTGDVWIILEHSATPKPVMRHTLPAPGESSDWRLVSLLNRSMSDNLVMRQIKEGRYALDRFQSSVVEFLRCRLVDRTLNSGRLWVELFVLDERRMKLSPKESGVGAWYERISTWIRKNYERLEPLVYAGPGALEFRDAGGKLGY